MTLSVLTGQGLPRARHERDAVRRLQTTLTSRFAHRPEDYYFVVNAFVPPYELDAMFFGPRTIAVLELKDVGSPFELNDNGSSYFLKPDGSHGSRFGGARNPFHQSLDYRRALLDFLANGKFLPAQKASIIQFRVQAVLVASPRIPPSSRNNVSPRFRYFLLAGEDELPDRLSDLDEGPVLEPTELQALCNALHLEPLRPGDESAATPNAAASNREHETAVESAESKIRLPFALPPSLARRLRKTRELPRRNSGPAGLVLDPEGLEEVLVEEAAAHVVTLANRTYAPNLFDITLAAADFESLEPLIPALLTQLRRSIEKAAVRDAWRFPGPIRIQLSSATRLRSGVAEILVWSDQVSNSALLSPEDRLELRVSDGRTVITDVPLTLGTKVSLGTASDNTICLARAELRTLQGFLISRHHARLTARENSVAISDGTADGRPSKNGTFVDGRRLEQGEEVVIGVASVVVLGGVDARGAPLPGAAVLQVAANSPRGVT